jgi:RHS repeat-associated protein
MPVAAVINGVQYAVHSDHLNTPRRLSDANKAVRWQWPYSGFGEIAPQATPAAGQAPLSYALRYPGQVDDGNGLFYNWNRFYDPRVGRYTSADPIGLEGGWNRFGYVGGNPVSFVDPEGLLQQCSFGIFGPNIYPFQHQYHCWTNANGTKSCYGFTYDRRYPSLKDRVLTPRPGIVVPDGGGTCEPDDGNQCMDSCAKETWSYLEMAPPNFALIGGITCQGVQQSVYRHCSNICKK